MSHKNYNTNYSNYSKNIDLVDEDSQELYVEQPLEDQTVMFDAEPEAPMLPEVNNEVEPIAEPIIESVEEPEIVKPSKLGKVSHCTKLNVRKLPSPTAAVVSELVSGSEVMIYDDDSTFEYYKVCTASGIEGYCMKKFIKIV